MCIRDRFMYSSNCTHSDQSASTYQNTAVTGMAPLPKGEQRTLFRDSDRYQILADGGICNAYAEVGGMCSAIDSHNATAGSYTHLRTHEAPSHLEFSQRLEEKNNSDKDHGS
eukprot:TRINITY_DN35210_c0_g1_i1.p2 TRINITY_DN35210_c0_g1~~TRINITY_DN35210_c0_g1_i1.p2  ORF type:complete len:112 (-),score=24.64 TRINITY_DN35210_c0_g1_i1:48-383(-)